MANLEYGTLTPPKEAARCLTRLIGQALQANPPEGGGISEAAIAAAVEKFIAFYAHRCGFLSLPGVDRLIPLSRVYVPVLVVDERSIRSSDVPKTLKQLSRQRRSRDESQRLKSQRNSLEVANQKQYLLVFGEPGCGKSTFLRWLTLEALQGDTQGNLRHDCLPIFLPLRYGQTDSLNIKAWITEQLTLCGFPVPPHLAEALLLQGKLLLLLDGLDEMPSDRFASTQSAIEAFVEQYPKNRYVVSCRKAAYVSLKRFATVDIAPLNSQQVAMLIRKHLLLFLGVIPDLVVHLKNLTLALGSSRLRDLTWNPLFLVTLCRVYSQTQQLPGNPSAVYREAINLVLEAVDPRASNLAILQEATLTAEVEKALLSELAHQGLLHQQLVYPGAEFEAQIQTFLQETLTLTTQPKAPELLQRLIQQGLLSQVKFRPKQHYYSFAHRSLQEYLTARYLAQYDTPIEPIVQQYVTDLHWREVFIFLAAQVDRCDRLLELMGETLQHFLQSPRIDHLLQWTHSVTQGTSGSYKPLVKRMIALAIALDRALDVTRSLAVDQAIDRALNLTIDLALSVDLSIAVELDHLMMLDLDMGPGRHVDLSFTLGVALELKRMQTFPDHKIAWLISRLEALKSRSIADDGVRAVFELWLKALDLEETWLHISLEEAQQLQNYLQVCLLMEQCQRVAVRVSRCRWDRLESQMLCPLSGM